MPPRRPGRPGAHVPSPHLLGALEQTPCNKPQTIPARRSCRLPIPGPFPMSSFNRPNPQFSLTPITVSHLPTPANITCLSTCFPRQDRRPDRLLTHRPPPLSWCTHGTSPDIPALLPTVMSKCSTQDTVLTTRNPAYNNPQRPKDQRWNRKERTKYTSNKGKFINNHLRV